MDEIRLTKPEGDILMLLDSHFLDEQGRVQPVSQEYVDSLPWSDLRYYCHERAIYTIVTHELLRQLKQQFFELNQQFLDESHTHTHSKAAYAIEIGSGNGTLARGLGIPATDNKMQELPMTQLIYAQQGQPTIKYPKYVEKLDAVAAIKKYEPHTVIGSWVTSCTKNILPIPEIEFPNEERIMELCERYILIGNMDIHKGNLLWNEKKYKHVFHDASTVRSRAKNPSKNFIVEFSKK
jgi:hypothetical protein